MTEQEKQKVINYVRQQVAEHGTIDIIRACIGTKVQYTDLDIQRLAGILERTGEFIKSPSPTNSQNYYIFHNPTYDLNESMKAANRSVQKLNDTILPENFKSQDKFGKRSLMLTGVSVIFILISTLLQLYSKTDKELQGIKEQLQKSSNTLDSIRLSLQGKDSSMKIFLERSSNKITNSLDTVQQKR